MKNIIGDLHCHCTMRPFNTSLPEGNNNPNPESKESIWHYDPPTKWDETKQSLLGISQYSQANFTALAKGGVRMVSNCLYAFELGFIETKLEEYLGQGLTTDATSLVTGIPAKDLEYVAAQKSYNYHDNLVKEHAYLLQLHGKPVTIENGETWTYYVVNDFNDLESVLKEENTIAVIVNIEGGHNFAERVIHKDSPVDTLYEEQMLSNLRTVKNWEFKPFYITVVHHFFNGICGNTRSIAPGVASKNIDQSYMLGTGVTDLGKQFIDIMLDDTEGNRILVDCKHLSIRGRAWYYDQLRTKYKDQNIPVLYTHAAVNGRKSIYDLLHKGEQENWGDSEYCTLEPIAPELNEKFNDWCINLFDDEIVIIGESQGMIGLEFDRRIAGYDGDMEKIKAKDKEIDDWTMLIWNQIHHIALTLDNADQNAWDCVCIGSDFDGIINSIYGIFTEEQMPEYKGYLLEQVTDLINSNQLQEKNQLDPDEIVEKIMFKNMYEFMRRNLKSGDKPGQVIA